MKLYLSARMSRKEELQTHAAQLIDMGHEVISGWLYDLPIPDADEGDSGGLDPTHDGSDMSFQGNAPRNMQSTREMLMADRAARIFTEILDCDGFVAFTDNQNHTREASYAEYGIALGRAVNTAGKKRLVWIVGKRYHPIHYYTEVKAFPTFEAFTKMLGTLAVEKEQKESKGG